VSAGTSAKAALNIRQAGVLGAGRLAGSPSSWLDCQLLLARAVGASREWIMAHPFDTLSERQWNVFESYLARRRKGEPIAYILGEKEFYGLRFRVDTRTLIPRPETEFLVDRALELCGPAASVLEIGAGSGCVSVALAKARPGWKITATDISGPALEAARENAALHGVENDISFIHADLFPEGKEKFDLIVSNPPYVCGQERAEPSVHRYEPHVALYSGGGGMAVTSRIISHAPSRLEPGGAIALETGAGMADRVARTCAETGFFVFTRVTKDISGVDRVVSAMGPEWTE